MYESYFGLTERPFSIAPDPDYLYMSSHHKEAMAHLSYGLSQGGCFIVLTGEVGTGKTTLCRNLLTDLPENVDVALILNANLGSTELLQTVCDELKVSYKEDASQKQLLDRINGHLLKTFAENRHTVLIIDEAQLLKRNVLEQVRMLTNLETTKSKLLQIILIGQPELYDMLSRNDLRQLAQRVTARYHLGALERNDIEEYINYRLNVAGCKQPLFSRQALNKLYALTNGIPRRINVLADHALLATYSQHKSLVDAKTVAKSAKEVFIVSKSRDPKKKPSLSSPSTKSSRSSKSKRTAKRIESRSVESETVESELIESELNELKHSQSVSARRSKPSRSVKPSRSAKPSTSVKPSASSKLAVRSIKPSASTKSKSSTSSKTVTSSKSGTSSKTSSSTKPSSATKSASASKSSSATKSSTTKSQTIKPRQSSKKSPPAKSNDLVSGKRPSRVSRSNKSVDTASVSRRSKSVSSGSTPRKRSTQSVKKSGHPSKPSRSSAAGSPRKAVRYNTPKEPFFQSLTSFSWPSPFPWHLVMMGFMILGLVFFIWWSIDYFLSNDDKLAKEQEEQLQAVVEKKPINADSGVSKKVDTEIINNSPDISDEPVIKSGKAIISDTFLTVDNDVPIDNSIFNTSSESPVTASPQQAGQVVSSGVASGSIEDTPLGKKLEASGDVTGRITALRNLALEWQFELPSKLLSSACKAVVTKGLKCLSVKDWDKVESYNRPTVVLLKHNEQVHRVIVKSLEDGQAVVAIGASVKVVPVEELKRRWAGDGLIYWRPSLGDTPTLKKGDQAEIVKDIRVQLNQVLSNTKLDSLLELTNSKFDDDLSEKVKLLQKSFALDDDGLIGSETYLAMNEVINSDSTPVLRQRVQSVLN